MVKVGIIGGSGVYDPKLLTGVKQIKVHTPYGNPSDLVTVGKLHDREVVVIPRHGPHHTESPTDVNYRANIWAMKELGVTHILSPCAVGSLQDNIKPGEFVFVDQFIDKTTKRKSTFYEGHHVCHISVAEPTCPNLNKVLIETSKKLKLHFHEKGTYICIEGPRFSTRAESRLYRNLGAHIIGMTLVPECVLARETEICYSSIAMVTDYDTFKEESVTIEEVLKTMNKNIKKVKNLLMEVIPKIPEKRDCYCATALKGALL